MVPSNSSWLLRLFLARVPLCNVHQKKYYASNIHVRWIIGRGVSITPPPKYCIVSFSEKYFSLDIKKCLLLSLLENKSHRISQIMSKLLITVWDRIPYRFTFQRMLITCIIVSLERYILYINKYQTPFFHKSPLHFIIAFWIKVNEH